MDAFRDQLDELMGKDRDLHATEKDSFKNISFDDPSICKFYICGLCPHELFTNTKSDLGPCRKSHDEHCMNEYKENGKDYYEEEWIHELEGLIGDLDRKINKGRERLERQDDGIALTVPLNEENQQKLNAITAQVQGLLQEIETLGEEGEIDAAEEKMRQVEHLKAEKESLMASTSSGVGKSPGQVEKKMKVCEICGAFLVIGDTEKRTASHLEGKQHIGYYKIRQAIEDYKKKRIEAREKRGGRSSRDDRSDRDDRRSSRDRDDRRDRDRDRRRRDDRRDRDRDDRRDRDRDRGRDDRRDRDRRDSRRERDRDDDDYDDRHERKRSRRERDD